MSRKKSSAPKAPLTKIEELQESAAYWTQKVLEGTCGGLAIVGPGGLGKTYAVEQLLDKNKIDHAEKGKNSHITPLALFQTLYEHRNEPILLLDDIEHIYKNEVAVGLLRSALWGAKLPGGRRRRTVTYSTSRELKVPERFDYKGGIIIIGNRIPRRTDPIVDALLTRMPCVEFSVTPEDVYDFMRKVMVKRGGYPIYDGKKGREVHIPRKECEQVIAELEARRVTDLRKLEHALIAWTDFKRKPERLKRELDNLSQTAGALASQSPKDKAKAILLEIVEKTDLSENEKAKIFSEKTAGLRPGRPDGYDRATYFRWKQKWGAGELG